MAYEFHGIEFLDMTLEMQSLTQPAKLFGDILGIARLRSVQDQDASLRARHCNDDGSQLLHGRRCLLSLRMTWNLHGFPGVLLFLCFVSCTLPSRKDTSVVSQVYTCMGEYPTNACQCLDGAKQNKFRASDAGLPLGGVRPI